MQQQPDDKFGKRILEHDPHPKRPRPEKVHITQESTGNEYQTRGIKCGIRPNTPTKDYDLEDQLQAKKRILTYADMRNGISVSSLGDKIYKDTTYAPDFYKVPGVYPGSSNINRTRNMARKKKVDFKISKDAKWPLAPRTLWSEQVKRESVAENLNQVIAADNWEDTTLKEHKLKNAPPADPKAGGAKPAAQGAKKK